MLRHKPRNKDRFLRPMGYGAGTISHRL